MSLVGPRPELPEYVELFQARYRTVLTVRPGITDPASIRFRNEEKTLARSADPLREYTDRILPAKLDMAEEYIRKQSWQSAVPILMVSSESNQSRLSAVVQAGVSGVCDKPFEPTVVSEIGKSWKDIWEMFLWNLT